MTDRPLGILATLRALFYLYRLIYTFPLVQPWKKENPKRLIIYNIWELFKNLESKALLYFASPFYIRLVAWLSRV